ncbi:hypothetical protein HNY73_011680 [Argiope bruennichi]|uniref:Uncharacterized protein n=1 Tax=Argiope bruennichi TaxID=94029 RepID=A0A8T0EZ06_ARGBR|nr:hypothetical protein HNY73_011680 [Argiope bruennichi]
MIGRADIEGSKSDRRYDAWPPQASYPCDSRIPLVRASSESAVSRPPKRSVRARSTVRRAAEAIHGKGPDAGPGRTEPSPHGSVSPSPVASATPASDPSPTGPRSSGQSLCPEVTDFDLAASLLHCGLSTRGMFTLETAAGYGYGPARKTTHSLASDCKCRHDVRHRVSPQEPRIAFYGKQRPYLRTSDSGKRRTLTNEKTTLPRPDP